MLNQDVKRELFVSGHNACAGCGPAIGIRHMLRATGPNVVICIPTGCMEVVSTQYPQTAWRVPLIHVAFETAASTASGIKEALNMQKKENVKVIAFGGDGGLIDIGFGALSGMWERGHEVLTICYDNEAYMNTGVQRSGGTPWHASTSTTPAGRFSKGKEQQRKDMAAIALAHGLKYVATASIAFDFDFEKKVKKALTFKGPTFIHLHAPCTIGWKYDSALTIKIAKLAVETKMWPLFEIENGIKTLSYKPQGLPVKNYLELQGRFKHLNDKDIAEYQKLIDMQWKKEFASLKVKA